MAKQKRSKHPLTNLKLARQPAISTATASCLLSKHLSSFSTMKCLVLSLFLAYLFVSYASASWGIEHGIEICSNTADRLPCIVIGIPLNGLAANLAGLIDSKTVTAHSLGIQDGYSCNVLTNDSALEKPVAWFDSARPLILPLAEYEPDKLYLNCSTGDASGRFWTGVQLQSIALR